MRLLTYIAGRVAIVCLAAVALSWTVFLAVHALPLVHSIFNRAYFTATGVFTYYSLVAGLAMLLVDLAYVAIDPKIRY